MLPVRGDIYGCHKCHREEQAHVGHLPVLCNHYPCYEPQGPRGKQILPTAWEIYSNQFICWLQVKYVELGTPGLMHATFMRGTIGAASTPNIFAVFTTYSNLFTSCSL